MAMERQWPALPEPTTESLARWAQEITRLLRQGDIASGATVDALDALFLTPAEGDAAYVNVTGDTMTGDLIVPFLFVEAGGGSASGADEGGEIQLELAPNSTLAGPLIVDSYLDLFRIIENGGGFRRATLDISKCVGGAGSAILTAGRQTIWIPATALVPRITGGPAVGKFETPSNVIVYNTLDFDPGSTEIADFPIRMPKSWDRGTVTAQFVWMHAAAVTNFAVLWRLSAVAISDDDTGDASLGTTQFILDTGGTTNDIYISAETPAVTVGGSPAAGDLVMFRFARQGGDVSDTLAVDARLVGVSLFYTTNAPNDA